MSELEVSARLGVPAANPRLEYIADHLVAMMDVDVAQIHFSSYFRWMDVGASGLMITLGMPIKDLLQAGFSLPVVDARCRYLAPVALGQVVTCRSYFSESGRSSITMRHDFMVDDAVVAEGHLVQVWMEPHNGSVTSLPLPPLLKSAVWPEPVDVP